MKYIPFAVVLVALIPSPTYAQNTQFSDCRTLEAAGNNIGSDEALVNGMVCKAAKVKANSSVSTTASGKTSEAEKRMALLGIIEPETLRSKVKADAIPPEVVRTPAPASGKTPQTEKRMALLGIIEPETLRSKSKAEANAAVDAATPRTGTEPEPEPETEPGANVTPQSVRFEMKHNASLGDIARAYQRNSQAQAAAAREDIVELKKLPTEVKLTAAPTVPAPETPTTTPLQPGQKANALTAAQAPASELTREETPAAITPASVTLTGPQPAAKIEVFAAPQTPVPTVKAETNLPTVMTTPVITPEPRSDGKTEVFASSGAPPSQVMPEASPVAAPGAEEVAASEPQKSVKLGVFVEPQTSSPEINRPPEVVSYDSAQEDGFNDGQRAGCTKNVSLGSLDKEKLFLAIPEWAANWYEKNQKRFPGMCFSDSPMPGAQNYLVVFYASAPAVSGIDPLKNISASGDMSPLSGVGTFTTSYGSTWHYTYDRTATTTVTTVLTEKVPHNLQPNVLYAIAYSEQGIPISQHWPTAMTKGREISGKPGKNRDASPPAIHMMGELLNEMAEDIAKH
ncbi:MAG TPA: hypothetical protein VK937_20135 [Candidatus Limnocylindria bacterium]|nr:hypothetical protein [Candidatus Limnocylindria bacterium]